MDDEKDDRWAKFGANLVSSVVMLEVDAVSEPF